jgi:imidazole glycerol-phosphate synthase subunit HisH
LIAIIDYGMGNLGSVRNMLRTVGCDAVVTSDPAQIRAADKLILPGVGAFDAGISNLAQRGLIEVMQEAVMQRRVPMLGICLGMQLMCARSDEGARPGLGWIDADVKRFTPEPGSNLKVPHMGWNTLDVVRANPLIAAEGEQRFYFVHSFRVVCNRGSDVIALSHHGGDFVAAFGVDNVFGVQFHPEKSHRFGRNLMQGFAEFAC